MGQDVDLNELVKQLQNLQDLVSKVPYRVTFGIDEEHHLFIGRGDAGSHAESVVIPAALFLAEPERQIRKMFELFEQELADKAD